MRFIYFTISLLFVSAVSFAQRGFVAVSDKSAYCGYINLYGKVVVPIDYIKCQSFSPDGFAVVMKATTYSIINAKGETIPTELQKFNVIEGFLGTTPKGYENGLLAIKSGAKWGYLNTAGKIAIPLKYDLVSAFDGGFAIAQYGGKYVVLDVDGKETPVVSTDNIKEIKHFTEGLAPFVAGNELLGFINSNAETVIKPQFKSVGYFSGGLAWAKKSDDLVGFINDKGEWIIKPVFSVASNVDPVSKYAKVKDKSGWYYINAMGEKLVVSTTEYWGDFNEGLAIGEQHKKFGFFNAKGEWVIKAQYESVRNFSNGYAAAKLDKKWGIINTKGEWVIKPTYEGINDVVLIK